MGKWFYIGNSALACDRSHLLALLKCPFYCAVKAGVTSCELSSSLMAGISY